MPEVELKVNDKKIPLNDFMQQMLANIIEAFLKGAKEVPDEISTINIEIKM
ncbi:MAG: hypothetical protein ACP6IY_20945 [Promethearchaeia archaeon]